MHIGETIASIRNEIGMTQAELAEKMGVKPQTVSQYERGLKNPKPATIKKFADALGVDAAKLYAINNEQQSERALQKMGYEFADAKLRNRLIYGEYLYRFNGLPDSTDSLSLADKAASLAQLIGRLSAGDSIDTDYSNAAQVEKILEDFNKLNPAGREKALERIHELTEIPRYTILAVNATHASAAEKPTEAPQDHTVKRDTPSHD